MSNNKRSGCGCSGCFGSFMFMILIIILCVVIVNISEPGEVIDSEYDPDDDIISLDSDDETDDDIWDTDDTNPPDTDTPDTEAPDTDAPDTVRSHHRNKTRDRDWRRYILHPESRNIHIIFAPTRDLRSRVF